MNVEDQLTFLRSRAWELNGTTGFIGGIPFPLVGGSPETHLSWLLSQQLEAEKLREAASESPQPSQKESSVKVDVARCEVEWNGKSYMVKNVTALRWLAVLAAKPREWLSPKDFEVADKALIEPRSDRLKKLLPSEISAMIESQAGAGVRLVIPPE